MRTRAPHIRSPLPWARSRPRPGLALFLGVGLPLLVALPGAHGTVAEAGSLGVGLGLSLTAVPVNGTVPLDVAFHAVLTPNTTTATFSWAFGDGQTFVTSATGSSSPSHEYGEAGTYVATVSVNSSLGEQNATLPISVTSDPLGATIQATPMSGTLPLTVHFVATPSGGSGTYPSVLWTFGDGGTGSGADLLYTYTHSGTFTATVTVSDTRGHEVNATVLIQAGAGGGPTPGNGATLASVLVPYALGLALVLAVAAAIGWGYRGWVRRRDTGAGAPPGALVEPPAIPPEAASPAAGTPSGTPAGGDSTALEDSRRLSERLLIHLYWYGRPSPEGAARVEATQQGMARHLGAGQNSISKALTRLIESGTVQVELQHVPGAPRRVKTYSLTVRGEAVARSLQRRRPTPGAGVDGPGAT